MRTVEVICFPPAQLIHEWDTDVFLVKVQITSSYLLRLYYALRCSTAPSQRNCLLHFFFFLARNGFSRRDPDVYYTKSSIRGSLDSLYSQRRKKSCAKINLSDLFQPIFVGSFYVYFLVLQSKARQLGADHLEMLYVLGFGGCRAGVFQSLPICILSLGLKRSP